MRTRPSVAFAVAWQHWTRNRWAIAGCFAALAAAVVLYRAMFAFIPPQSALMISLFPLIGIFGHILNAFLFVEETGSLSSRYPRRMFTLPAATSQLVFWPMLYGSALAAALWLASALLLLRPNGFDAPILMPALGIAAAMALLQAASWAPIDPPWVRLALIVITGSALTAIPLSLMMMDRLETPGLTACLLAYSAAAYLLGWAGVKAERKGDSWGFADLWRSRLGANRLSRSQSQSLALGLGSKPHHRSAADAQLAYEWSCHGWLMPGFLVLMTAPVFAIPLAGRQPDNPQMILAVLGFILGLPLFIASTQGAALGRLQPFWVKSRGVAPFLFIRPITTEGLVSAKFRMAARSVLLAHGLSLVFAIVWISALGAWSEAASLGSAIAARHHGWRAFAILGLAAIVIPVLSWRQTTSIFAAAFYGRRWLTELFTSSILGLFAVGFWLSLHPDALKRLPPFAPGIAILAVILKGAVAAWAFRLALRRGLMTRLRALAVVARSAGFAVCAAALLALLIPDVGSPIAMPPWTIGLGAVWLTPLARFAIAPLALDLNRRQ